MRTTVVLFDGWSLVYAPLGPQALHLHALLDVLPENNHGIVALPGKASDLLPERIEIQMIETPATPTGRLDWEQRRLPGLAHKLRADFVHTAAGGALLGSYSSLVSPAGYALPGLFSDAARPSSFRGSSLAQRFRDAFLQGGLSRARWVFWPADLPTPSGDFPIRVFPPLIPGVFWAAPTEESKSELPESFVLYHGPIDETSLRRLLDAWSWAAPAIGDYHPLYLLGLDMPARRQLDKLLEAYQLADTVKALDTCSLAALPGIYHRATALFHPAPLSPWGDPGWLALVCAKPIVSLETVFSDARFGPAAYLVPPGDSLKNVSRALGAALVTVIVEESLAENLSREVEKRTASWKTVRSQFQSAMATVYRNSLT